jgi:hypothetical protein
VRLHVGIDDAHRRKTRIGDELDFRNGRDAETADDGFADRFAAADLHRDPRRDARRVERVVERLARRREPKKTGACCGARNPWRRGLLRQGGVTSDGR